MKRLTPLFVVLLACFARAGAAVDYPDLATGTWMAAAPFNLTGQLYFASGSSDYLGSGTVIRPSSILTAGHNLFDRRTGWSTDLLFRRGASGTKVLSEQYATRIFLMGGYQQNARTYGAESVRTFAYDMGGLLFARPLAAGAAAGYSANTALLTNTAYAKIGLGYGAEGNHSGDYPLYVKPTTGFYRTYGSFFENRSIYIEGGMSGGPLFSRNTDGKQYVTGVIVAGSDYPYAAGGIRIIDAGAVSFITTYLR